MFQVVELGCDCMLSVSCTLGIVGHANELLGGCCVVRTQGVKYF